MYKIQTAIILLTGFFKKFQFLSLICFISKPNDIVAIKRSFNIPRGKSIILVAPIRKYETIKVTATPNLRLNIHEKTNGTPTRAAKITTPKENPFLKVK